MNATKVTNLEADRNSNVSQKMKLHFVHQDAKMEYAQMEINVFVIPDTRTRMNQAMTVFQTMSQFVNQAAHMANVSDETNVIVMKAIYQIDGKKMSVFLHVNSVNTVRMVRVVIRERIHVILDLDSAIEIEIAVSQIMISNINQGEYRFRLIFSLFIQANKIFNI